MTRVAAAAGAAQPERNGPADATPLVVDLDGTLIRSDLLHDGLIAACKSDPGFVLALPGLLRRGKATVKHAVAARAPVDPAVLPYNDTVLALARDTAQAGRPVILATASPRPYAEAVARHLGLFSAVVATNGHDNLAGPAKLRAIRSAVGDAPFDYVGNAAVDLPVWAEARTAIVANAPGALARRAASAPGGHVEIVDPLASSWRAAVKALRPQQWIKNLLIFVPLIASHRLGELPLLASALLAFVAFGLIASGTYIINDLLDIPADRAHPRKRLRPFASGRLPVVTGIMVAAAGIGGGLLLGASHSATLFAVLGFYLVATLAYSLRIKRIATLDIFTLASLYTVRVIAGSAATGIEPSVFLLAFSMFLFFALASVKRVSELVAAAARGVSQLAGRGYRSVDLDTLTSLGTASSYAAIVVLALYIQGSTATELYSRPQALWALCAILMYWISRVWIGARRGAIHDDPIVFAVKDRVSRILLVAAGVAALLAGPQH